MLSLRKRSHYWILIAVSLLPCAPVLIVWVPTGWLVAIPAFALLGYVVGQSIVRGTFGMRSLLAVVSACCLLAAAAVTPSWGWTTGNNRPISLRVVVHQGVESVPIAGAKVHFDNVVDGKKVVQSATTDHEGVAVIEVKCLVKKSQSLLRDYYSPYMGHVRLVVTAAGYEEQDHPLLEFEMQRVDVLEYVVDVPLFLSSTQRAALRNREIIGK